MAHRNKVIFVMKKVLILGAGMVSRPIVRYLLNQSNIFVTVADLVVEKAERVIDNNPHGSAVYLDVSDDLLLEQLITQADVVVSLLPYVFHVKVAKVCIKNKKHLVTTSYVSEEMKKLDVDAKDAGVLLLNECGLDPGIDHMSAMRIIHQVEENGGKIISFKSTTGALPSHEANTNPFGYKFSWSPRGVLLASRNSSRWLKNGKIMNIPSEKLFQNYYIQDIPMVGTFENYSNRDSVSYRDIYGLKNAETIYRGTFRMIGWCETMQSLSDLGWLKDTSLNTFKGMTYGDLTRFLLKVEDHEDIIEKAALHLGVNLYSTVIKRLEWLGLFDGKKLPEDMHTPLDYLNVLTEEKLTLGETERDMIVMHHEFIADYDGKRKMITSTLVTYGNSKEKTAVSRTVALPAAIAVKMILDKTINLTGVHIPVLPKIYQPILDELENMDVVFNEKVVSVT
jgi:saccharopine dehydrogenase-like NADP-dependent oxidoreductase